MKIKTNFFLEKLVLGIFIVFVIAFLFWYKFAIINTLSGFINLPKSQDLSLVLNEKDELEKLRVENQVLKGTLSVLQTEMNLMEDGLEPTYVKVLSNIFTNKVATAFYGSFYVTYPNHKTVYKGMNVYAQGNVLVGTIEEVLKTSLFINRIGAVKPFIAEDYRSNEQIELSLSGNGLYIGNITTESKISVGDLIVLKGYPKAIIGYVVEIQKNAGTLSKVFVRAPFDLSKKKFCMYYSKFFILIKKIFIYLLIFLSLFLDFFYSNISFLNTPIHLPYLMFLTLVFLLLIKIISFFIINYLRINNFSPHL